MLRPKLLCGKEEFFGNFTDEWFQPFLIDGAASSCALVFLNYRLRWQAKQNRSSAPMSANAHNPNCKRLIFQVGKLMMIGISRNETTGTLEWNRENEPNMKWSDTSGTSWILDKCFVCSRLIKGSFPTSRTFIGYTNQLHYDDWRSELVHKLATVQSYWNFTAGGNHIIVSKSLILSF